MVHASRLQQVVLGPQVLIYVRYQACPAQHWQLRRRRRLRHRCARHNPVGSYLVGAKTTPLSAAGRPPAVTFVGPRDPRDLTTQLADCTRSHCPRTRYPHAAALLPPPCATVERESQKTRLTKKNWVFFGGQTKIERGREDSADSDGRG